MSTTPDNTLADTERVIADLQRQLAECKAERDKCKAEREEALQRETATAEVLQVINSSSGDLTPVFEAILEKALRLCDAAFGVFWTFDGVRLTAVTLRGVPPAYAEFVTRAPLVPSPGTAMGRVIRGEPFVHKADMSADPAYLAGDNMVRTLAELGGVRSLLTVPLRKEEKILGIMSIYRQEQRSFSDRQIGLLKNFAAQAVIAMENARLLTEQREALEQQTATAEVLQVINASPGDLTPVFEAILDRAHSLCGATVGNFAIYKDGYFHALVTHGFPEQVASLMRHPLPPNISTQQLINGMRLYQIEDIRAIEIDPDYLVMRALVEYTNVRTVLFLPLRKDDTLLGFISVNRAEIRSFSEKEIALLENFAAQAVIAIENARLLGELRQRTGALEKALEYQIATSDVLKIISRADARIDAVLDTLVRKASHICEADQAMLHQLRDGLHYVVASFGCTPEYEEYVARNPIKPGRGTAIGRMSLESRVIHIDDVLQDSEYSGSGFQRLAGFRTLLAVPLLREDTVIGSLLLTRLKVAPFTEKQIEQVRTFADQAAIAIENARLLGELRQRTDQVAELNRGLEARVAEQVEELGRVGRLKRFLAPQLAELIVSQGNEGILESHRREIVVVFCDLRGYTAFTETAEPEEVLDFLRGYHGALGPLVRQFEGTLDQFSGDGIMVFFNDPVPIPDSAARAVNMAVAMREAAGALIADWRERGRDLGFGAGIAQGYATLGQIGFAERSGYTAIGTVCNVAARLCAEAQDGQILLSQRVNVALKGAVATERVGALALKGLTHPIVAYNVPLVANQAAFRLIEGGAPSA